MQELRACCGSIRPDTTPSSCGHGLVFFRCRTCGALYAGSTPPLECVRLVCSRCLQPPEKCCCVTSVDPLIAPDMMFRSSAFAAPPKMLDFPMTWDSEAYCCSCGRRLCPHADPTRRGQATASSLIGVSCI